MSAYLIADLVFVLLGVLIIWRCAKNGFLKCLFKFVRTILAIVLAYLLVGPVAPIVAENFIQEPVYDWVYEKTNGIYMDAEESLDASSIVDDLPDFIVTDELTDKLDNMEGAGEELVAVASEAISEPIVAILSNVVAFVALFILLFILLSIAVALLNSLLNRITLFHVANTILGWVWGIAVAGILWILISTIMSVFFVDFPIYQNTIVIKFLGEANLLETLGILDLIKELLASVF